MKLCKQEGCDKFRHFGHPNGIVRFCGAHKEAGMVNLSRKACEFEACSRPATQGCQTKKKRVYCSTHQKEGMVNLVLRICKACEFEACSRPATHGCPTKKKRVYCSTHQKEGMVNLVLRICLHPGCGKSASYKGGAEGKFLYCATHKEVHGSKARQRKQTTSVHASGMSATPDSGGRLSTSAVTEGFEQNKVAAAGENVVEDKLPLDSTKDGPLLVTPTTSSLGYNKRQCDAAAEEGILSSAAAEGNLPLKKIKK